MHKEILFQFSNSDYLNILILVCYPYKNTTTHIITYHLVQVLIEIYWEVILIENFQKKDYISPFPYKYSFCFEIKPIQTKYRHNINIKS